MSVVRSPDSVLDSQLDDVIVTLSTADGLSLDAAGRLVATTVTDGVITSSAVDSPRQNLTIYRQFMLEGDLGTPLPDGADILNTTAKGLGAASDKGGEINVDQLAYLNQILGLDKAADTYLAKICINPREEVMGTVETVEECFLNYGGAHHDGITGGALGNSAYQRKDNFSTTAKSLPNPPYISDFADLSDTPKNGWFEVLGPDCDDVTECTSSVIIHGPILDDTFGNGVSKGTPDGFMDGNITSRLAGPDFMFKFTGLKGSTSAVVAKTFIIDEPYSFGCCKSSLAVNLFIETPVIRIRMNKV